MTIVYDPLTYRTVVARPGEIQYKFWSVNKHVIDAAGAGICTLHSGDDAPADTTKLWLDLTIPENAVGAVKAYNGSSWVALTPALFYSHIAGGAGGFVTNLEMETYVSGLIGISLQAWGENLDQWSAVDPTDKENTGVAATLIAAHEAAGDPHPQYLTAAEGSAAFQPLDADLIAWAAVNPSSYSTTAQIAAAYQPLDSELAALAGLTSAADSAPYFTGSGTAALMTVTAAARTVLDDTTTGAMLTTLGAQPTDATLTALAAYNTNGLLTQTAADTFTGRTLTGTAAEITVTNGDGVSGNPTLSIPSAVTLTGKTLTGGTFASPTLTTPTIGGYAINATAATTMSGGTLREVLSADRTYYVRTDGSDSNTGLVNSAGGGFLTLTKAWAVICALDLNTFTATVQVADGTYTGGINTAISPAGGQVTFQGNSGTPANVVISVTSTNCFGFTGPLDVPVTIKDMKLQTTTSGSGIRIAAPGVIYYTNLDFGALATFGLFTAAGGANIFCQGNYAISGAAAAHFVSADGGSISCDGPGKTITITGTPAITTFSNALRRGGILARSLTFSGATTGTRYSATMNGTIETGGGGANYFPGNAAGSTATGGQYA